ncbi:hypothetical protein LH462_06800 [Laribacter hongkongensis]|uniref:Uncharacterized protein n=1 Tax=Laribacter hongkongensis TaxID=168471 RepID=A0ABD4SPS2_9NEIS|nr:hypothetical protein [Laribacter hongkongensis]MCG9025181.1 hypothetical protein [Laribacter hongkongensis]MCG9099769.1 hypothetical protein [Laribacter hongkongensis]MCG9103429.1 hypothetical protein [Laribacter hongkongensis]MCG9111247.1 hypothetical protein [Laribacter hongkongensis]MCG9118597.1 hypothetical protein [Laribacter hongkongensis]
MGEIIKQRAHEPSSAAGMAALLLGLANTATGVGQIILYGAGAISAVAAVLLPEWRMGRRRGE